MSAVVRALCVGRAKPLRGDELSAIDKHPVEGLVTVTTLGLAGDEQADRRVHGGPDMALHAYSNDHYSWWLERFGAHDRLPAPGSFGENLPLTGIDEWSIHIGDRFRLGSSLIEVSQPRQPCWKLEAHLGQTGVMKAILSSHRSGWYFRVIEEGEAKAPCTLELAERGNADWSVARAFAVLLDPRTQTDADELKALAQVSALSAVWRDKAFRKASQVVS